MFGKCESLKQNNKLLDINISLKDAQITFSFIRIFRKKLNIQEFSKKLVQTVPVLCSFQTLNQFQRGQDLWKFNNSLFPNVEYVLKVEELINKVKEVSNRSNQFCDQIKWEVLEQKSRCFTIKLSENLAKARKSKQYPSEKQLKYSETNLNYDKSSAEYISSNLT